LSSPCLGFFVKKKRSFLKEDPMAYWNKLSSRGNVEDRRRAAPFVGGVGGVGVVGFLIYVALTYLSGGDIGNVLNSVTGEPSQYSTQQESLQNADNYSEFAATVLGSDNDLWRQIFAANQREYAEPRLVLFRQATSSGCGYADSQVGPHYCPNDATIYLDETFFDELLSRFGAKGGDVAEAYVISHEVGHHVQNLLGLTERVRPGDNKASVRLELQADCFAGVWANSMAHLGVFEPGEVSEALDAAADVGDDRIQKTITGRVTPENWTHGSSQQRVEWFNRGYESGDPSRCET
jgi:predicted metalloprotease